MTLLFPYCKFRCRIFLPNNRRISIIIPVTCESQSIVIIIIFILQFTLVPILWISVQPESYLDGISDSSSIDIHTPYR